MPEEKFEGGVVSPTMRFELSRDFVDSLEWRKYMEKWMERNVLVNFNVANWNKVNQVENVFYNPPYTTILWEDGSKSTSKSMEGDEFDPYVGFYAAVTNHIIDNKSEQKRIIKSSWNNYQGRVENSIKKQEKKAKKNDK